MRVRLASRLLLVWAAFTGAFMGAVMGLSAASPLEAAELVMFDSPTCVYCKRFKREAAPLYNESRAARVLPLRIVQLDRDPLWFRLKRAVKSTPTFVIVEGGSEVERFSGYAGRDDFLEMMDGLTEAYRKYK
jgi:thioredoxin-related protein